MRLATESQTHGSSRSTGSQRQAAEGEDAVSKEESLEVKDDIYGWHLKVDWGTKPPQDEREALFALAWAKLQIEQFQEKLRGV